MQNVFIQIAIGICPVVFFFLMLGIFTKKHKLRNIISASTLALAAVVMAVPQLFSQIGEIDTDKANGDLGLIYAVAEEGSVELAQTLLEDMRENYQPEFALAAARFAVQNDDFILARALYLKSIDTFAEAENELFDLTSLCEVDEDFYSVTSDSNVKGIYEKREESLSTVKNNIANAINKSASDFDNDDNLYSKLSKYIVYADNAHKDYINNDNFDAEESKKQLRKLNTFLEENPKCLKITQVRLSRLKLQILCEEYKAIAACVSEDSDYNELLIVSELYLNNYVKQSNFSGDFSKTSVEKYQKVYDKLNNIYTNSYMDKSREERNTAKAQIKSLSTIIKNPALGKIEEGLYDYASNDYSLDASKAYLQMAKIENSLGNEQKSVEYIDRSIDTVGDCEDSNYTVPMYELVGIIADKDNPERLKDAAVYVDEVLDNNMTVKMNDNVPADSESESDDELVGDFTSQMQTYVSQKRMSVNIVNVDTTKFENESIIKATVNISNNLYTTATELKNAMKINDCGVDITDFTVEKITYSGANILLCVDTSGSMGGDKIENLKNAIKIFAADKSEIESISLITFDNGITGDYPFGLSIDELTSAADGISANGGTAIYDSLIYSTDKFTYDSGVINSIILMTDGQDGYSASIEEIEEYIGKPCKEKGITVYTIGFGSDADDSYLHTIAVTTGGAYLYASDPTASSQVNQLEEFFSGLRSQILNQYTITFKAIDTLSYSRELRVNVGDGLDGDRVKYYIGGGADSIIEPDADDESTIYMDGKAIYGFEPKLIFKNGKTMDVLLKGTGFSTSDNISVSLKGNTSSVEWDLGVKFIDESNVSVTIPAGVGIDVYDAYVNVNGKTAVLPKGLSIFKQGSEQITDFGQYRFVSYVKQQEDNAVHLSGYVTMNGWLNFNGDITLSGDLNSGSISLMDSYGSYVKYDKINSEGLAKALACIGLPVHVPALGIITLYNDTEYENQTSDFKVEMFPLNALDLGGYFSMGQIQTKLYPNRATFDAENILATLPFAKKVLKNKADLFSFDYAFGGSISSKNVGIKIDIDFPVGDALNEQYYPINLGNAPIYVSPQDTELHIDTLANDYEFKFMVKTAFLAGGSALGLSAKWDNPDSGSALNAHSNGLVPTEFKLYADFDVNTTIAGVPVTYSDFMLGIEDIDTSKKPIHWTLVGGCDISAAKVTAVPGLEGLKDWIGDVSVLKLDDAKLSLNLGECYVKAETTLKLFEELNCGNVLIEMGKFSYTSALLKMNDESVVGLRFVGTLGPDWKFGESSIKLQITGEFDALSKFIGIQGKGSFDANFKVWIISIGASVSGEAAIGIRITSDGTTAFIVRTNPSLPNGGLTWPKNVAGKL